jgi:hypothetical protein
VEVVLRARYAARYAKKFLLVSMKTKLSGGREGMELLPCPQQKIILASVLVLLKILNGMELGVFVEESN